MKVERENFKGCKSRVKLLRLTFNNRADMMKLIQFVSPLNCLITNFAVSQDYFFRFRCFQASRRLVQIPMSFHIEGSALTRFCHEACLHVVVNFSLRYHTTSCMQTRIWNRDVVRVRCKDWDSDPINLFRVPFDTPNPKPHCIDPMTV